MGLLQGQGLFCSMRHNKVPYIKDLQVLDVSSRAPVLISIFKILCFKIVFYFVFNCTSLHVLLLKLDQKTKDAIQKMIDERLSLLENRFTLKIADSQ